MAHVGHEVIFEPVHFVQPHIELSEFVHFGIEFVINLFEFTLSVGHVAQHAVERLRELLEFIVCLNFGAGVELAAANAVTDVAEVFERLDNDIANNDV